MRDEDCEGKGVREERKREQKIGGSEGGREMKRERGRQTDSDREGIAREEEMEEGGTKRTREEDRGMEIGRER